METNKKNKIEVKKVRSNLISIFFINTVVLFTLSLIGFVYLNPSSVENYFKENITISIYLKKNSKEYDHKQLIKYLNLYDDVKETDYLSKVDAAKIFSEEIGEDFIGFLGYNPLLDAISVKLDGNKIDVYSIEEFISNLSSFEFIEEIQYDKPLVEALNKNFEKIGLWILIISILFLTTSFVLINNSIKISIYSKRDIIKTMQLVGATKKFIRNPFIWTYIKISFLSSISSLIILFTIISQLNSQLEDFKLFIKLNSIISLVFFIITFGVFSSFLSSYFITQRYLKLKFV